MTSLLSEVSIFRGLAKSDHALLKKSGIIKKFKKGDSLFQEEEHADRLFIVTKGLVKLFRLQSGSPKEEIVCFVRPPGYCCLAPVLARSLFHINATAIADTETIVFSKETVLNLIDCSHVFAKNIIHILAEKECDLCEEVCELSLKTTKERLASYLLEHASQASKKTFPLNLNQAQLAAHLGTVREKLSRDFSALKKAKMIRLHKGLISILNEPELDRLAGKKNECSHPSTKANIL